MATEMLVRPRITEGHTLLAHYVRRGREFRGIDTNMLVRAMDLPLAMIEDIESAEQFGITLNDVEQLAAAQRSIPSSFSCHWGHR